MNVNGLLRGCGILFLIILISIPIGILCATIQNAIEEKIYEHRLKHRFDKPPTAKCYCKDCAYHGILLPNGCECQGRRNYYSPDDGFCHEAKPKSRFKNKI